MKNFILLLWIMISVPMAITAQKNYAYHYGSESTYNMVCLNHRTYYLEKSLPLPGCCNEQLRIVSIDNAGKLIARYPVLSYSWLQGCIVRATADKKLLVLGQTPIKHCDDGDVESTICAVDTQGTISWSHSLNMNVRDIAVKGDGGYYIASAGAVYEYHGTVNTNSFTLVDGIVSVLPLPGGKIVISYTTNAGNYLKICDSLGTTIRQVNSGTPLFDMQLGTNGNIYARATGELQKLTDTLTLLYHTLGALPAGYQINAYSIRNDSVFAIGTDGIHPAYFRFDHNLNLLYSTSANIEKCTATGIAINSSNLVNISCWGSSAKRPSQYFSGVFNVSHNGQLVASRDVGVTRIAIQSAKHTTSIYGNRYGWVEANATVRNFGQDTVNSFHLNNYLLVTGTSYCLGGLNKLYTGKIPPGDSILVNTGTINVSPYSIPNNASQTQTVNYQFCLFTTVPDSSFDINIYNDENCVSAILTPVGIDEELEPTNQVSVHPNPSTGTFKISANTTIESVTIFDGFGKLVGNEAVNATEFQNVKRFAAGVYLARITVGSNTVTMRIIIVE